MSFHETFKYLSMKHYVFKIIGTIGLVISIASSIKAFEISFEVALRVVGGIVSVDDERVIYFIFVAPASGRSLITM